jgi:hypothetical protein
MRALFIALLTAAVAIPSVALAQDQGLVGGRVGANLESISPTQPGSPSWARPYGSPERAPQERAGYAGAVAPGQVVPPSALVTQQWGGQGVAFVNGHRVQVDPSSGRITRVLN